MTIQTETADVGLASAAFVSAPAHTSPAASAGTPVSGSESTRTATEPSDHTTQSRRALMHSASCIFFSCLFALLYEAKTFSDSGAYDLAYLVNFVAGLLTSAVAYQRAYQWHPKQATILLGTLLLTLTLYSTILMGLGLRAPIMELVCVLILGVNFTLGRKAGRMMLWTSCLLLFSLFALEETGWIAGMSAERNPPPVNAFMVLLCLYMCAYVFSGAFQQRSDKALAELASKNLALQEALNDKQQALEQRERALQEKARAQAAKDRFLATMSHEIRTPMAGIRTAIALLQNPRVADSARTRYIAALDTTTESLLRLLNDLLDTAQLEAGALNVQSRPVQLDALVADTVALFELSAKQKRLDLCHDVQCEPGEQVMADPSRLRQMISNLLGNAIKFTQTGAIHVEVSRPDALGDPALWLVRITDTGPGISEQDLQKLFKPFSQLDNQGTTDHGGSGLGLSIVQKLAHAMGGETGVISTPGKGSTFWFSMRLQGVTEESHAAAA